MTKRKPKTKLQPQIACHVSDGADECALCARHIKRGRAFLRIKLQLLYPGSEFNACGACVSAADTAFLAHGAK